MFDALALHLDVVAVLLPCGVNPAFADGHALGVGVKAVEQIFDGAAPGLGVQGIQTYDLSSHPRWFGLIAPRFDGFLSGFYVFSQKESTSVLPFHFLALLV